MQTAFKSHYILVVSQNQRTITKLRKKLATYFAKYCLDIEFIQDNRQIGMYRQGYVQELLERIGDSRLPLKKHIMSKRTKLNLKLRQLYWLTGRKSQLQLTHFYIQSHPQTCMGRYRFSNIEILVLSIQNFQTITNTLRFV